MQLTSPDFTDGAAIPLRFTCDGENVNPELHWSGLPEGTRSLSLIVDDPDSPNGTFVHWTVWNILPEISVLLPGSLPEGVMEGITSFEKPGYGGPCPSSGTHRYFFKLFALDTTLDLEAGCEAADLECAMNKHILSQAELVGLYSRLT